MREFWFRVLILVVFVNIAGCSIEQAAPFSDIGVPEAHRPGVSISRADLQPYTIAYCWHSSERYAFDEGRTDIIVSHGDGSRLNIITYPITPPQSIVNLGCFGPEDTLRIGKYGLAWRPQHNQLTMVSGISGPPGDKFYFVDIQDDLRMQLPERPIWQHRAYFWNPDTLAWSPDGEWLATGGEDTDEATGTHNIWLYNPDTGEGLRVTSVRQLPSHVINTAWSPDGKNLAVGYGLGRSGIGIARLDSLSSIEVSNENQRPLRRWPYKLGETLRVRGGALTLDPREQLQIYLHSSSAPVWIDQGQRIAFIAPASGSRVALFVVRVDGTDLQELLPGLPGLAGLPGLTPDGRKLAFVRYPGWKERDRAEIAVVDLNTNNVTSLAVLPAPANGDELYISGLDWTPDGKYLAFSSNHEGQSDVYVMSSDGQAWTNLTEKRDGDAVNPVWRP